MKFNYKRNSKTKKGDLQVVRVVTREHEIYKLFSLAKELQKKDGIKDYNVHERYIKQAIELISKDKNEKPNQ